MATPRAWRPFKFLERFGVLIAIGELASAKDGPRVKVRCQVCGKDDIRGLAALRRQRARGSRPRCAHCGRLRKG